MPDTRPSVAATAHAASFAVGATDVPARHTLPSILESVSWIKSTATPGEKVRLVVSTRHVGDGAPVVIDLLELSGRRVWRVDGSVAGGRFQADVPIPVDLPASVTGLLARSTLPRHNLEASSLLKISPPIQLARLAWSRPAAGHRDRVRLFAEASGQISTDTAASVQVYRAGPDGADEPLGAPFAAAIERGRLDAEWEVPAESVLNWRASNAAVYFRLTVDGHESDPSPLLHIEAAGANASHRE